MNVGIICNIISNKPIAIIGVNKEDGAVGYISTNNELENIIEAILDEKELEIPVTEKIDEHEIIRLEKITSKDSNYLMAFNYHLPAPWKMLGITYSDGDLEETLNEIYSYIMSRGEDDEQD